MLSLDLHDGMRNIGHEASHVISPGQMFPENHKAAAPSIVARMASVQVLRKRLVKSLQGLDSPSRPVWVSETQWLTSKLLSKQPFPVPLSSAQIRMLRSLPFSNPVSP